MAAPLDTSNKLQADNVSGPVTFDATAIGFTLQRGADVVFGFSHYQGGGNVVIGVTIGGTPAQLVPGSRVATDANNRSEQWAARDIAATDGNIVVTFGGGADNYVSGAAQQWYAQALARLIRVVTATGSSATPNVSTVQAVTGPAVISTVFVNGSLDLSTLTEPSGYSVGFKELQTTGHEGGGQAYLWKPSTGIESPQWTANTSILWAASIAVWSAVQLPPLEGAALRRRGGIRRAWDVSGWYGTRQQVRGWFWRGWAFSAMADQSVVPTHCDTPEHEDEDDVECFAGLDAFTDAIAQPAIIASFWAEDEDEEDADSDFLTAIFEALAAPVVPVAAWFDVAEDDEDETGSEPIAFAIALNDRIAGIDAIDEDDIDEDSAESAIVSVLAGGAPIVEDAVADVDEDDADEETAATGITPLALLVPGIEAKSFAVECEDDDEDEPWQAAFIESPPAVQPAVVFAFWSADEESEDDDAPDLAAAPPALNDVVIGQFDCVEDDDDEAAGEFIAQQITVFIASTEFIQSLLQTDVDIDGDDEDESCFAGVVYEDAIPPIVLPTYRAPGQENRRPGSNEATRVTTTEARRGSSREATRPINHEAKRR